VPFAARAVAGGRGLAADMRALVAGRTADGGDPPHTTVVGHSYGSTVVGAAATTEPLEADDLVLLGSPGAMAEHVSQLGRPRGRVFVGEAAFDLVADLGVFGADPGDAGFGAIRVRADPSPAVPWTERVLGDDHSRYFDVGSESLRNVARVVVGRAGDVTLDGTEGER
jgi:pimeloyl-ACP methyl ester carboxylesterase